MYSRLKDQLTGDLAQLRALSRGKQAFVHTIVRSFLTNVPVTLTELQAAAAERRARAETAAEGEGAQEETEPLVTPTPVPTVPPRPTVEEESDLPWSKFGLSRGFEALTS